jgi:hypothetical protein
MKASDLRIGNYISPLGMGITVVEGFCLWDGLIQSSHFAERGIEDFKAIPLTKEWLLKIGFEFAVDTWYLNGFALWETEWGDDKGGTGIGYFYELREKGMMDKHIEYVHQLQNLYYSLTGEEIL